MTWPPVRMAMSCSISLRRSPKPGALTHTQVNVPRSLLRMMVASASPLDVVGDDDELLARVQHGLEHRQDLLNVRDLLVRDEDERIVNDGLHLVVIGDHIRGDIAAVELHALDDLGIGLGGLALLDGDDAVLADLLHRLGGGRGGRGASRGEWRRTPGSRPRPSRGWGWGGGGRGRRRRPARGAAAMTIGLAPAARFFRPSRIIACASTVAEVVPSPATSLVLVLTSRMSCAPMFSNGSSSSISFCNRHAVVRDQRSAELLAQHHVAAPWGRG